MGHAVDEVIEQGLAQGMPSARLYQPCVYEPPRGLEGLGRTHVKHFRQSSVLQTFLMVAIQHDQR
jgi:hypothetical protein